MKQADITSKVSYGSNLLNRCLIFRVLPEIYGGIAQLGEHLLCKQGVSGSIPLISTTGLRKLNTKHGLVAQVVRAHA